MFISILVKASKSFLTMFTDDLVETVEVYTVEIRNIFFKRFICSVSICLMAPIMVIYVMKFRMNAESILCLEISADVLKTGYHKGGEEFEHVKRGSYHFSDSVLLIEISQIVIGSRTWLSNFIHINLWCVIIQPCPNFSSCIDKPLFKLRHGWVMDKIWHGKFLIYA